MKRIMKLKLYLIAVMLAFSGLNLQAQSMPPEMADSLVSDFGINLLESEIDAVLFQTNEFLTDATFIGASGPFWWLPLPILQNTILVAVNQLFINSCLVIQNQRGTKTGQNHGKIKSRTLCPKYPLWNTSVSFAKVQICPLKNEGKSLFLSFTTHFPTIVPQMWLLQTVLTSSGLVCENWVLNFVSHSVGHFQKRELAIEPKICHPYCPILGFVNV